MSGAEPERSARQSARRRRARIRPRARSFGVRPVLAPGRRAGHRGIERLVGVCQDRTNQPVGLSPLAAEDFEKPAAMRRESRARRGQIHRPGGVRQGAADLGARHFQRAHRFGEVGGAVDAAVPLVGRKRLRARVRRGGDTLSDAQQPRGRLRRWLGLEVPLLGRGPPLPQEARKCLYQCCEAANASSEKQRGSRPAAPGRGGVGRPGGVGECPGQFGA